MKISIKILLTAIPFLGFFLIVSPIFAQENLEAAAKKYGVSFPVAELGSCTSFSQCRSFCDKEENRDACISFAKKKGFYEERKEESRQAKSEMVQSAKNELGCGNESSCRNICEKQENIEKCSAFAQKYGLDKPRKEPGDRNVLRKAQEILGCNSEPSCKAVCGKEENQQKCSEFAKQTGLGGGIRRVGPGGCNSEESCKTYCEKNMDECRKLGGKGLEGSDQGRRGPGGCNSEESCAKYCQENPQECQGAGGPGPRDMEKYCRENPERCPNQRSEPGRSSEPQGPEDFCRQNPDRCQPPPESSRNIRESFNRPVETRQPVVDSQPQNTQTFQRTDEVINREAPVTTDNSAIQQPMVEIQRNSETTQAERTTSEVPQVQGISTSSSLLDTILNYLSF